MLKQVAVCCQRSFTPNITQMDQTIRLACIAGMRKRKTVPEGR